MRNVQWVVQSNLNSEGSDLIEKACREIGAIYTPVEIIPFSDTLPDYDRSIPAIFYGSTTMGRLVFGERGYFFDAANFHMQLLSMNYRKLMLNYPYGEYTIEELVEEIPFWDYNEFFIRPLDDSKSFVGQVINGHEIKDWFAKLQQSDSTEITTETEVLVTSPKRIETEWRLWIVRGKVIAASQYRRNDILIKKEGCPAGIKDFAEFVCRLWTPHDVFCMDVCVLPENRNPFIVECGCFNSCGFYAADVNVIVKEITNYYETTL